MSKTYTLKIPRPQYDRLGAAELIKDDTFFKKFISVLTRIGWIAAPFHLISIMPVRYHCSA